MRFKRKKIDRYEYYFMRVNPIKAMWPNPEETEKSRDYSAFGNLGSQGWRYVGIVNGMYAFERKSHW